MKWSISGGMQDYNTERVVEIGSKTYSPQGTFQTISIRGAGEAEIEFIGDEHFQINPVLGVQAAYIMNEKIEETGGEEANLIVSEGAYPRLSGSVGLRIRGENYSNRWNIYIYGGYIMVGAPDYTYDMQFKEAQEFGKMKIRAGDESQAFAGLSAGYEKDITPHFSLFANADIKVDPNNEENKVSGYSAVGGIKIKIGVKAIDAAPKPEPEPEPEPTPAPKPEPEPEPDPEQTEPDFSSLDNLDEASMIALLEQLQGMDDKQLVQEAQERRKNLKQSFRLSAATFKSGSAILSDQSKTDIKKLAENLKAYDYQKITVEGHTDSTGIESKNKILSLQRAKAVYDQLIIHGLPKSKLSYIGFGSLIPISTNKTAIGKQQNRRVEVFVE
jgi:outer membrane protein OmpA-like peptidoglycan-associated protein